MMNWVKGFALATCLATPISVIVATSASAEPAAAAAPSSDAKKPAPTKAMLSKCTDEANAKGLFVKSGKANERKEFRRQCVRKAMGLDK